MFLHWYWQNTQGGETKVDFGGPPMLFSLTEISSEITDRQRRRKHFSKIDHSLSGLPFEWLVVSSPAEGNIFPLPPRARPLPFGTHFVLSYIRRIMCGCAWGIWKEYFEFYLVSSLVFDQARLHLPAHRPPSGFAKFGTARLGCERSHLGRIHFGMETPF